MLPFAPSPPPRQLSDRELKKIREDEENTMRELRIFLRDVHCKLLNDRRFKEFAKSVDLEEVCKACCDSQATSCVSFGNHK